jgi:ketosteroid isomerase-like protein
VTASSDDVDSVVAVNNELYAAFEAGDLDRMQAVWIDGDLGVDASCVHPGWTTLRGRGAILRSWAVIMANTSYIQFFLTDVDVRVSGDVAVVTCTENILTPGPAGADAVFGGSRAVSTNVFRRTPAGWRVWVHHASPVISAGSSAPDTTP